MAMEYALTAALTASDMAMRHLSDLAGAMSPIADALKPYVGAGWAYTPGYLIFFVELFALAVLGWRQFARLPSGKAAHCASCVMSFAHGTMVCLVSLGMLHRWAAAAPGPWHATLRLDLPTTGAESLLAQFSLAYLLADTLYMAAFTPDDVLLMAHHAVAAVYMAAVLHLGTGGITVAFTLFLGEITSPLLNAFTVSKEMRHTSPAAAGAMRLLSPLFTAAFVINRSVLCPPLVAWFLWAMWFRSPGLPPLWSGLMGCLVAIGMVGSQLWSYKLLRGFMAAQRKRRQAALGGDADGAAAGAAGDKALVEKDE